MEPNEEAAHMPPGAASADAADDRGDTSTPAADHRLSDAAGRADEEHRRAESYVALLKRERADFTNYRRRVEQERAEQAEAATADVMQKVLPALSDLERALNDVPAEVADSAWVAGIRLIDRGLRAALERAGLTRISAAGQPFDPQLHEALLQEEAPGREGTVVRELQPGYRLGERVLRPAQVSVARGAPSLEPRAPTQDPPKPTS